MNKVIFFSLIVMSMMVLNGCGDVVDSSAQTSVMGNVAAHTFKNVGISDAKMLVKDVRDDFVVLDVRTPAEYAEGHLINAINIDYEAPDFATKIESLIKSKTYLVYCRSGRRSAEASQIMNDAGFSNIINILGGINAWKEAGGEISA